MMATAGGGRPPAEAPGRGTVGSLAHRRRVGDRLTSHVTKRSYVRSVSDLANSLVEPRPPGAMTRERDAPLPYGPS
jgi:hypothetical protein